MTVRHHPLDLRLFDCAAGRLPVAESLVVRAHLAACPACRARVAAFEHVGGTLICDAPPMPLAEGRREATLAHLNDALPVMPTGSPAREPTDILIGRKLGPWRWSGPGIRWRRVETDDSSSSRAFLLEAAAGTHLIEHSHSGSELTLVMKGSFSHAGGRFTPGDVEDADGTIEHRPVVGKEGPCLCLVAMEGRLRVRGMTGRLLAPLIRF